MTQSIITQPISWLDGPWWPYLAMILFCVLPTEMWRWLAVAFSRRLHSDSPVLDWVRAVATALLAGIVGNLIVTPPGALADVPWPVRWAAVAVPLAVVLRTKAILPAVLAGEAVLLGGAWYFAG